MLLFVDCRIGKKAYLCSMIRRYVITGINVLTGLREALSLPMTKDDADNRLRSEKQRRTKNRAYRRLRVDRLQPVQLTLKFDYEL